MSAYPRFGVVPRMVVQVVTAHMCAQKGSGGTERSVSGDGPWCASEVMRGAGFDTGCVDPTMPLMFRRIRNSRDTLGEG